MKLSKKLLVLMLCLGLSGVFTACSVSGGESSGESSVESSQGGGTSTDSSQSGNATGGVTENEWDSAISEEKFNNVTFGYAVVFKGETKVDTGLYKLDGVSASYVDEEGDEELLPQSTNEDLRNVYVGTTLAVVENFENFTYDAASMAFVSTGDIVYNVTVMEYETKITASNVKVKLDANKNIAEISCYMKQESTEDGEPFTLEFDVTFTFTNYGATTIGGGSGGNNGNSGTTQTGMSAEKWSSIFSEVYELGNVTIYCDTLKEYYANSALMAYTEDIKITKTAAYTYTDLQTTAYATIYSVEDGKNYYYSLSSDEEWQRKETRYPGLMGGNYLSMTLSSIASLYEYLEYDAATDSCYGENFVVESGNGKVTYDMCRVTFKDGLISKIEVSCDIIEYANEGANVIGNMQYTWEFSDYGTTVVELPTEYTDKTAT